MKKILTVLLIAIVAVVAWKGSQPVAGVVLPVAVIGLMTVWTWRRFGGAPATRRMVIPLYGGLLSFIVVCTGVVIWLNARNDYRACLDRRDRSEAAYQSSLLLFDVIDAATGTTHYTSDVLVVGKPSLRGSLLAPITAKFCAKYKP